MERLQFVFLNVLITFLFKIGHINGIIGGFEAGVHKFPYQVSIQVNNIHYCGGSIISDQHILSAAHCFINQKNEFYEHEYFVLGGVIHTDENTPQRTIVAVKKLYLLAEYQPIQYSKYTKNAVKADIIVLKLEKSLNFSKNEGLSYLQLPTLPLPSYIDQSPIVSGFGFGSIVERKDASGNIKIEFNQECKKLKYAVTKVFPNIRCEATYDFRLQQSHICAQVKQFIPSVPEGVCKGDSGGPLVLDGVVIGVLCTCTAACNERYRPAIYTNVGFYLDFIQKAMADENSPSLRIATYKTIRQDCGIVSKKLLMESA